MASPAVFRGRDQQSDRGNATMNPTARFTDPKSVQKRVVDLRLRYVHLAISPLPPSGASASSAVPRYFDVPPGGRGGQTTVQPA